LQRFIGTFIDREEVRATVDFLGFSDDELANFEILDFEILDFEILDFEMPNIYENRNI
jgi:hypothetical protein